MRLHRGKVDEASLTDACNASLDLFADLDIIDESAI